MLALEIACRPEDKDRLIAELHDLGTVGIIEHEQALIAYFSADADAGVLTDRLARFAPRVAVEPGRDWGAGWRACWRAEAVGKRFFLAPEWSDEPVPPGRIRLWLRPGLACGTGLHPCTRLCLEWLEEVLHPGHAVADVGTGSGLLAEAAAQLGAGVVIACDLAEEAISEARRRFEQEGTKVFLFQGSLRSLRTCTADVVLVNISAPAAVQLAPELRRVAKPGGAAVVSGFRLRGLPGVSSALQAAGFRNLRVREREGWQALLCYAP